MQQPEVKKIAIDLIDDDPTNTNKMSDEDYASLVAGIKEHGNLQPILVRPAVSGRYPLVDGEHRKKACKENGHTHILAVVSSTLTREGAWKIQQFAMNKIRGDMDLGKTAKQIAELHEAGWTVPELTLSGFSASELEDLIKATKPPELDVMTGPVTGDADTEPPEEGGTYTLELTFETREDLARAKRALRKAAGKGRELSAGLLNVLDQAE